MRLIHPYTHGKAAFIERFHKSIQKMFWNHTRHISTLQGLRSMPEMVESYNTREHSVCSIIPCYFSSLFLQIFNIFADAW